MIPLLLSLLAAQSEPGPAPAASKVLEQRQVADRQLLICRTRAAEVKGFPEEELGDWRCGRAPQNRLMQRMPRCR